jgi:hypothetical protein
MHLPGQTTTFQTRLEESRACRCWSERYPNCSESWLLPLDGAPGKGQADRTKLVTLLT